MKLIRLIVLTCFVLLACFSIGEAQQTLPSDAHSMQQSAMEYLKQKDYANSIMLLNQAIRLAPDNVSLRRDLAYTYYLSGKQKKAREIIEPVVQSDLADEQTFQIAAAIENVSGKSGKAKRFLTKGLKKFPHSGMLYNNLGNLYSMGKKDKAALEAWETGIEVAPGYGLNYYGAARMFHSKGRDAWAIVYAEIYLNLEQNDPQRSNQMKKMMISAYQMILSGGESDQLPEFRGNKAGEDETLSFEHCFKEALKDNAVAIKVGLNAETLTMLRTRFIMEWDRKYANLFPFTLFTWQNKVIRAGFFDAYNQWLFGAVEDSQAFQLWVKKYAKSYNDFEKWHQRNPLQPASYDPKP